MMPEAAITLQAVGSNLAYSFIQALIVSYLATVQHSRNLNIVFSAVGASSNGICRLKNWAQNCQPTDVSEPHSIDFAVSFASILGSSDYQAYPDLQMYPLASTAVVPIFNLPILGSNDSLILTGSILSSIYLFNITSWSDHRILAVNPAIQKKLKSLSNYKIKVVGRKDASGASSVWTSYIAACSESTQFAKEVGVSSAPRWKHGTYLATREVQMAAIVGRESGSIGFLGLYDAYEYKVSIAQIQNPEGKVVAATVSSIAYANIGMIFGSNGDASSHLTASLLNPQADVSWPIAAFAYLVMRKSTLRFGGTCQYPYETVKFWSWFYSSPAAQILTQEYGFAPLSSDVQVQVLQRLQSDIMCSGQVVYMQAPTPRIPLALPEFFHRNMEIIFEGVYKASSSQSSFNFITSNNNYVDASLFDAVITQGEPFRIWTADALRHSNRIRIPFAGIAYCFLYNVCGPDNLGCNQSTLTLDGYMIYGILTGQIRFWNDSKVTWRNPDFSTIHHPIRFFYTSESLGSFHVLNSAFPSQMSSFTFAPELLITEEVKSEVEVMLAVMDFPYSIAFLHFDSYLSTLWTFPITENPLVVSNIVRNEGSTVSPSLDSIAACALDTYNAEFNQFNLLASRNPKCYPLSTNFDFIFKKSFVESVCDQYSLAVQLADFASWIFQRGIISGTYTSFMIFPLYSFSDQVYRKVKESLYQITCNGVSLLELASNYHYISMWAFPVAVSLLCFTVLVGAYLASWISLHRRHMVVRASQPAFLYTLILGVAIMTSALIPLSLDDRGIQYYSLDNVLNLDVSIPLLESACRTIPWLYLTGFALEFSALFVKVWRLKKIFLAKSLKKVRITARSMLPILAACLSIVWFISAVWTARDPLHWERFPAHFNSEGFMVESYGHCASENFAKYYAACGIVQLGLLVFGMALCYQTRNVAEDFVENKWITIVLVNMTSALLLTTLLGIFMSSSPSALFAIAILNVLMNGFGTMMFMIVPKIPLVLSNVDGTGRLSSSHNQNSNKQNSPKSGASSGGWRTVCSHPRFKLLGEGIPTTVKNQWAVAPEPTPLRRKRSAPEQRNCENSCLGEKIFQGVPELKLD